MNILLVDDQPNILSSLVSCIPWHSLGISSIHTATSAAAAREILSTHNVDIMITDIEMPHEDGLSLINWVRENNYSVECILLTSHADFFYAKRAISLHVAEYIIQPARDEDVINAVKKTISKLKERSEKESLLRYSSFDFGAKNIVAKSLFNSWPSYENSLLNSAELADHISQLSKFNLQCSAEERCTILFMHIRKWHKLPLSPSAFLLKYREVLGALDKELRNRSISYHDDENTFFTVFCGVAQELGETLQTLYQRINSEVGCSLRMYYCESDLQHLQDGLTALKRENASFGFANSSDSVEFRLVSIQPSPLDTDASYDRYTKHAAAIKKYILEHISEPITRTQIADALFLSPGHISYIIKETENLSCKELITKLKMEYARNLLRCSKCAIGDIATRCGYDSFAYFSKVYKQTYSITPSMEREQNT